MDLLILMYIPNVTRDLRCKGPPSPYNEKIITVKKGYRSWVVTTHLVTQSKGEPVYREVCFRLI